MSQKITYPTFKKSEKGLLAITGPKQCFLIQNTGSNKNDGVILDRYISRKVVRGYESNGWDQISQDEFVRLYKGIYQMVLNRIIQ